MDVMNEQTIGWTTQSFNAEERYAAWEHQLNAVYGSMEVERPTSFDYKASVRHRSLKGLKIVECVCDPCGGTRSSRALSQDAREILGVQLVLNGKETFRFGSEQILLEEGDIFLWDNTRPISFRVQERLHKLAFIMPLSRFQSWLPSSWYAVERKISRGSRSANLLSLYMRSLGSQFLGGDASDGDALTESTIGLIVNALGRDTCREKETLRSSQMLRVKHYIDENLASSDLSPALIASANNISVRYLHWLFLPLDVTVTNYIIQLRLQRCYRELSNPAMHNRTIMEIAFSWGFTNSTHFSRRFKQEFGVSPSDFRKTSGASLMRE